MAGCLATVLSVPITHPRIDSFTLCNQAVAQLNIFLARLLSTAVHDPLMRVLVTKTNPSRTLPLPEIRAEAVYPSMVPAFKRVVNRSATR